MKAIFRFTLVILITLIGANIYFLANPAFYKSNYGVLCNGITICVLVNYLFTVITNKRREKQKLKDEYQKKFGKN